MPTPKINQNKVLWKLDKGVVTVLFYSTGEFFQLNGVGSKIWELIAEGKDEESIITTLANTFDAKREKLAVDLDKFLKEMLDRGMLEEPANLPSKKRSDSI